MQSNQDGTALVFSDIMHTPSPSPRPSPPLVQSSQQIEPTSILAGPSNHVMPPPSHWTGSTEPEPLNQADIDSMRTRLQELSLMNSGDSDKVSPRENELIQMVLRLTSHPPTFPDPMQLAVQADIIAGLTQQRNFLLEEKAEEQQRWEAEREGWERMAEALIGKRKAAADASSLDDDTQRHISRLADDNKALRQKLSETQQRLTSLESDLNRLRPLLLLQTFAARPDAASSSVPPKQTTTRRKRKGQESSSQVDDGDIAMISSQATEILTDVNASQFASSSRSQTHYRSTRDLEPEVSQTPGRKSKKIKSEPVTTGLGQMPATPLLSDARSEMLLSAARKIGRLRAGVVAGLTKQPEPEPERIKDTDGRKRRPRGGKDKQKAASAAPPTPGPSTSRRANSNAASTPRTPRRTATAPNLRQQSHLPSHLHPSISHPTGIVYINPAVPPVTVPMHAGAPGVPVLVPLQAAPPGSWPVHPGTPSGRQQAQNANFQTPPSTRTQKSRNGGKGGEDDTSSQGPGTPFNSLLTAARTLMVDEAFDDFDDDARTEIADGAATPRGEGSLGSFTPRRRRRGEPADTMESPIQNKRRKLAAASSLPSTSLTSTPEKGRIPAMRVRSALDVLADQAAQEQERRPSVDPLSRRPSAEPERGPAAPNGRSAKGKGKATDLSNSFPLTTSMGDITAPRRLPSAPPIATSPSESTYMQSLSDIINGHNTNIAGSIPIRPSTPPNRSTRAASEEPSPSRRSRSQKKSQPQAKRTERANLGTPRKITVISVQPSSTDSNPDSQSSGNA
ncbi:unnamed protein product [Somion occarium]|uniref:Uncharacterized protein n=1 Tax=Somion occarium TaxID=3059160 RepID=A0ABP1CWA8_9APHY